MSEIDTIRCNFPCSVELPAGTGKTQTIGNLVKAYADESKRALVLTHTHAGVDVLKRRLKKLGVPSRCVSIRTLDSWCFDIIRSFPILANIEVGEQPDWSYHKEYHTAGSVAVAENAIVKMLKVSYDLIVVDEYQDCQTHQHELVKAVSKSVDTCVFGDRMQGLFFWSGTSVIWERDVEPWFTPVALSIYPWRWHGHNIDLGHWLIDTRQRLLKGSAIDLGTAPISVVPSNELASACFSQPRHPSTVVAISLYPRSAALLALRLGGAYTMIEEIEGKHLKAFAQLIDDGTNSEISSGVREYAVSCAFGVAGLLPSTATRMLSAGQPLDGARFPGADSICAKLNRLQSDSSAENILDALVEIAASEGVRLYRREAWFGVLEALRMVAVSSDLSMLDAVTAVRQRISHVGRRPESRIVGRPLLIKGLEFDHAVISDPDSYNAHELYVALSRGSKSVTVASDNTIFGPTRPNGSQVY